MLDSQTMSGVADCVSNSESVVYKAKRLFDIVLSSMVLILLAPLLVTLALVLKFTDLGPAIYRHTRVGCDGRRFDCFKFRTMVLDSENVLNSLLETDPSAREEWERDRKLKNDPRVTRLGALLRASSADELPQLFNVLLGHMSLVGPRPVTSEELERYGDDIDLYLSVRPGVTGPWQVCGRSELSWEERVKLDANYVRNWQFSTDLLILLRTMRAVIQRRGSW
jgi:exopolysaccharide production protein ExoY